MADEKYRLQLEGSQVDDALLQMNQRVPEGWAVGTRDGSPVGPGSQFHQNNAKYYAEQAGGSLDAANAAAARAEAAVPAGTAGAVFFDRDQSLTDGQKGQAKKNIVAGSTNPNILINGYFVGGAGANSFPINSRGLATYTGSTWTVDCWRTWDGGSTVTIGTGGLTFSNNLNGDALFQYIKDPVYLYGKIVTVSAIINGKLYSATGTASADCWIATSDEDVYSLRFSVDNVAGYGYVCVQILSGKTITIEAIKLEIGMVSTIVGDVPQDRELEYIRSVSCPSLFGDTVAGRAITPTSNQNLFDNWYFGGGGSQLGDGVFPINQRAQASYSGSGVTAFDRWICDYGVTATLQSGGVRVQISALYSGLSQVIPAYKIKSGETYTFSIIVDGTLHSATFTAQNDGSWNNILFGNDWYVPYQFANGNWYFKALNAMNVDAFDHLVSAVKLEKGTVSTLANDPVPDFGAELAKCMRYLWYPVFYNNTTLAAGITFGQTSIFDIVTPVPMNSLPNIMLGGDWYVALNGALHTITGVTATFKSGNHLRVQCSTADDLGSYNACSLLLGAYQGDNFNAEL